MYRTILGMISLAIPTFVAESQVQVETLKRFPQNQPTATKNPPPPPPGEAPIGVRATPTATTIGLRWGCPQNVTGFDVFVLAATGSGSTKLNPSPLPGACLRGDILQQQGAPPRAGALSQLGEPLPQSGYTHGGLVPGQQFTYIVRALYANGAVGDAPPITAQTAPWPAPSGLTATAQGQFAELRWQPVPGAPGYIVMAQAQGQAAFTPLTAQPITSTTFGTPRLQPALEHRFQVQTVNGLTSPTVAVISGRPFNMKAHDNRFEKSVTITWEGTEDAVGSTLYRASSQFGPWTVAASGGQSPQATEKPATVGTSFYKVIVRWNPTATVESPVIAGTLRPLPQGVTNLRGTSIAFGTVKLMWTCDPEAMYYTFHVSRGGLTGETLVRDAVGNELRVTSCEQTVNGWSKNAVAYDMTVVAHYPLPFGAWGQLPTLQASVTVANKP